MVPRMAVTRMPKEHLYTPAELDAFEARMGVRLPGAYRFFLSRSGWPLRVSALEDWSQPYLDTEMPRDFLARPFPHQDAWNDLRTQDPAKGWDAPYYDKLLFQGAMRIVNLGCEGYNLLVVSGVERGSIWCDHRADFSRGIYPLSREGKPRVTFEEYVGQSAQSKLRIT